MHFMLRIHFTDISLSLTVTSYNIFDGELSSHMICSGSIQNIKKMYKASSLHEARYLLVKIFQKKGDGDL